MNREDLQAIVFQAVNNRGGQASIVEVAQDIWENHQSALKASGDLFFTWQYEMRWAAQKLRDIGKLKLGKRAGKSVWQTV